MDDTTRGVGDATADRPGAGEDVDRRTSEIRRDIAQTREEMSETIEAIEERLRPRNILSNATQSVKHAATERMRNMKDSAEHAYNRMWGGTGTRSRGVMSDIRHNPFPAVLIGVGTAWLLMNRTSKGRRDDGLPRNLYRSDWRDESEIAISGSEDPWTTGLDDEITVEYVEGYPLAAGYSGYGDDSGGGFVERVRQNPVPAALAAVGLGWLAMSSARGRDERDEYERWSGRHGSEGRGPTAAETASRVRDTVSDAASSVADSARNVASRAQEYTRDAANQARYRGRRAQSQLQRMARENPLMVGAGALLLGSIVGLAIPETDKENELLGEARDSMLDRAQEMARNVGARAQETAADLAGEAASRIVSGKQE